MAGVGDGRWAMCCSRGAIGSLGQIWFVYDVHVSKCQATMRSATKDDRACANSPKNKPLRIQTPPQNPSTHTTARTKPSPPACAAVSSASHNKHHITPTQRAAWVPRPTSTSRPPFTGTLRSHWVRRRGFGSFTRRRMRVLCYWYALIIPIVIPVFVSGTSILVCLCLCLCLCFCSCGCGCGCGCHGMVYGVDG
jgi:hypothetical protein